MTETLDEVDRVTRVLQIVDQTNAPYQATIQSIQLRAAAREVAALPLVRYKKGTR